MTLCDRAPIPGAVDGAWWPHSDHLGDELPDLVAVISRLVGSIRRVVYDPSAWSSAPKRVIHRNGAVAVDAYRLVAHDTIYLVGSHSRDALLYVIGADVSMPAARAVLDAVDAGAQPICAESLRRRIHPIPSMLGERQEATP
ncbi:DUF5994 family protein [Mycobacterium sp. GA-2829]|uniref:DUF5994 family protein n=1 Tax=Mycobacterium sp. GA-2829 TaxID=1772283 RepID=UPI001E44631B|nr:DUF5994 family protein [Mycobacterium sp. GA-2829]